MMKCCIYTYTNNLDGKIYVGKTNNMARRHREHIIVSKVKNTHFYNAIKKYGIDNFTVVVIAETKDIDCAYELERLVIAQLKSNDKMVGYNLTDGGDGVRGISDRTRQIRSAIGKTWVGHKNPFYGKRHSVESKSKISDANTGHQAFLGKHHTESTKQKISQKNSGKRMSPSTEFLPGQTPHNAKINFKIATDIRRKSVDGLSRKQLQAEYGLSKSQICKIIIGDCFPMKET